MESFWTELRMDTRERDPRCGEREDRNLRNTHTHTHTPGGRERERGIEKRRNREG